MRTQTKIVAALVAGIALVGCMQMQPNAQNQEKTQTGSGSTPINPTGINIANAVQIKTANEGLIGYLLEGDEAIITVFTPNNWITHLFYDGSVNNNYLTLQFSGAGCTGTAIVGNYALLYGKTLYYLAYSGHYYKPAVLDANGNGVQSSFSYVSQMWPTTCSASSGSTSQGTVMALSSRAEAGLPATITPPLVFVTP